ncbi:hypothetical protein TSUD_422570 [Trifolium subterraneum]|uniref:Uncharacterized protein n=1 Tax=Trifolium subterraneum TaxID=3900 RepID=A0A1B5Z832_TRISU|nr:hypothetical protein TSUD_422570 [Trifolium subterraneum]
MEIDNGTMHKKLNELEQNTVASFRKALRDVAMEIDVAVVTRVIILLAQLRTLKKCLKEAEDEQQRKMSIESRIELNSATIND